MIVFASPCHGSCNAVSCAWTWKLLMRVGAILGSLDGEASDAYSLSFDFVMGGGPDAFTGPH